MKITMIGNMKNTFHGRRVLLVEDEWLIALDIGDILERWGCTVVGPAANVAAALAIIEEKLPDAAILDVHLNGETSERVADTLRDRGCPFIVLTAYQRHHLVGALGEALLLRKPVDEDRLQQHLIALLRK